MYPHEVLIRPPGSFISVQVPWHLDKPAETSIFSYVLVNRNTSAGVGCRICNENAFLLRGCHMARRSFSFDEFLKSLNESQSDNAGSASRTSSGSGGSGSSGSSGGSGGGKSSTPNMRNAKWSAAPGDVSAQLKRFLKRLFIFCCIIIVPVILVAYWWFHPSLSFQSPDLWLFISVFILLPLFCVFRIRAMLLRTGGAGVERAPGKVRKWIRLSYLPVAVVVVVLLGAIGSSVVFPGNAERYATILHSQVSDFSKDIHEVNYSEIPVIDRDSAVRLGNRVMGSIPEYVSQFEVSDLYSQINYRNHPVRVSPLLYADIFKWFNNNAGGLPAYVLIDMTTQNAQIVRLDEGMRYSQSEPFERNIDRHIQLSYPFYLLDQKSFEIDDDGHPWWVCPVQTRTIGLFGGTTITRVILCDAVTGECQDLSVEECPVWVDRVYPSDLLIEQYNWSGAYAQGWINSWLGQEGVVQTTPGTNGQSGYNYIAKDDDVWVYTGVTSAVSDNSIVGFVLINQRTAESHYYAIAGATEESAMYSAEGQVQHLGYRATFPLLLNINSQPTYFMALKDNAGLVKMYAMLDIQRYQNVAVGDTLASCQRAYQDLLRTNGVEMPEQPRPDLETTTGTIARISTAVIGGNSHYYLMLEGDKNIYDCALPEFLEVLTYEEGDRVTISYRKEEDELVCIVEKLTLLT